VVECWSIIASPLNTKLIGRSRTARFAKVYAAEIKNDCGKIAVKKGMAGIASRHGQFETNGNPSGRILTLGTLLTVVMVFSESTIGVVKGSNECRGRVALGNPHRTLPLGGDH
jgi:hypothetical protein